MRGLSRFVVFAGFLALFSAPSMAQTYWDQYGAMPNFSGVAFKVWAPNASNVTVAGEFNSWNQAADPLTMDTNGYWYGFVTNASVGQKYKYVINSNSWRRDPRGLKVVNSAGDSVIWDPSTYQWDTDGFVRDSDEDLVIYEMHMRTYNPYNSFNAQGTFYSAIDKLNHLQDLGINAVQLMPVMEFPGDNSWGYNPSDPFSVESIYGGPEGLQQFVDAAHARGIAVILDVVHNHWGPSDLVTWQFDEWAPDPNYGGVYHYNTAGLCCTDWGDTRPDYSRPEVRDYIKHAYQVGLEVYQLDGFRTDSPYHMGYYGYPGSPIADGESLLQEINTMMDNDYPNALSIQENGDTDWGFDSRWDMTFHGNVRNILAEPADANRNMWDLASWIDNGAGLGRVIYLEAHDSAGDLNERERISTLIDLNDPTSYWSRKRSLLGAVLTLTAPGIPMIFQGEEMLETEQFSDRTGYRWELHGEDHYQHHLNAYYDLVHLRRNLRGGTPGLKGSGIHVHHVDDSNKVIAYKRWDAGGDDTVVVMNFSVNAYTNNDYEIEFPWAGDWYVHFQGDSTNFGVDYEGIGPAAMVTATGATPKAVINMAPYSAYILSQAPLTNAGTAVTSSEYGVGCDGEVTITYTTGSGPLAGATNVQIMIGHDGWKNTFTSNMTQNATNAAEWSFTYANFPGGTRGFNFTFTDGVTEDDNLTKEWYQIVNCNSAADFIPENPVGCTPVTIRYEDAGGPLAGSTSVFAHVGQNDWSYIVTQDLAMVMIDTGIWEVTYQLVDPAYTLHVAFNNENGDWDTQGGQNWNTSVSDCHTNTGTVWLDPAQPNGCDLITIFYDPGTGPLATSPTVNLFIGVDTWQNVQTIAMTQGVTNVWSIEYQPGFGVDWMNFVFNDGVNWDNNYAADWNYSLFCPPVDGIVTWTPSNPVGCVELMITYQEQPGCPLENATNIYIDISTYDGMINYDLDSALEMTEVSNGYWEATFSETPPGLTFVDVIFHDNNSVTDFLGKTSSWYIPYSECAGASRLVITNPFPEVVVSASSTIDLSGLYELPDTSFINWSNELNGQAGTIAPSTNWSINAIPLADGTNYIEVSVVNDQPVAFDSALDTAYDAGILLGTNGGTGFGSWFLHYGYPDVLPDVSTTNPLASRAWRFYGGNHYQFSRPFSDLLLPGSMLSFKIDVSDANFYFYIDLEDANSSDVGWFRFGTAGSNVSLSARFDASYAMTLPASTNGYEFSLEVIDDSNVDLTITSLEMGSVITNGTYAFNMSGSRALKHLTYYGNAGTSPSNWVHLTDLQIVPPPSFMDWINVVYANAGPVDTDGDGIPDYWEVIYGLNTNVNDAGLDPDGDLFTNGQEFNADTDPTTNASYLGVSDISFSDGMAWVNWHGGSNALQTIQWSTNISEDNWFDLGTLNPPTPINNQTNMAAPGSGTIYFRINAERP